MLFALIYLKLLMYYVHDETFLLFLFLYNFLFLYDRIMQDLQKV